MARKGSEPYPIPVLTREFKVDHEVPEHKRLVRAAAFFFVGAVLLVFLAGLFTLNVLGRLALEWQVAHEGIVVPCIEGLSVHSAREALKNGLNLSDVRLGLQIVEERMTGEVAAGTVLHQEPGCKEMLTRIRLVRVVIARAP